MKIIVYAILIITILYGGIYIFDLVGFIDIPKKEYYASASQITEKKIYKEKKAFTRPVEVEWTGEIFAVLQSGNGYAIKRLDPNSKFPKFMAFWPDDKMEWTKGNVKIKGFTEGIDCAYQNTIFDGECVPFVTIKSLEKIEIINK